MRQEVNSPTHETLRVFGGALICHLIAFGVGMALASIGSRLPSAGVFVFFGSAVSALLGFHLGQKLHAKGARSSNAVGLAVIVLSVLAMDIAGVIGLIVAAVSGASIFLGWKSTKRA
jgi:putative Mn2+ efflux pump MntP